MPFTYLYSNVIQLTICSCSVLKLAVGTNTPETPQNKDGSHNSKIWCEVKYSGNLAPKIQWRQKGGDDLLTDCITENVGLYTSINSTLTILDSQHASKTEYECLVFFDRLGVSTNTSATNVPEFIWTSRPFVTGKDINTNNNIIYVCR